MLLSSEALADLEHGIYVYDMSDGGRSGSGPQHEANDLDIGVVAVP